MRVFLTNQSLVLGASFILLLNSCSKEVKKQEFVIDIEKINLEFSSQTSFKTGVSGKWIVNALDEKGEPDKRITFSQPCVLSTLNKEPIIDFNSACGTGPAEISLHFNRPMISDVQTLTSKIFFKSGKLSLILLNLFIIIQKLFYKITYDRLRHSV